MRFSQKVAEQIKMLAKKKGVSVNKTLLESGIQPSFVNGLMNKGAIPAISGFMPLSNYFGVSLDYLLTGRGEEFREAQKALSAEKIADLISEELRKNGFSANVMCKECGLSTGFLNGVRKGSMPAADKILTIARFLGVSVDYLVTGNEAAVVPTKNDEDFKMKYDELSFLTGELFGYEAYTGVLKEFFKDFPNKTQDEKNGNNKTYFTNIGELFEYMEHLFSELDRTLREGMIEPKNVEVNEMKSKAQPMVKRISEAENLLLEIYNHSDDVHKKITMDALSAGASEPKDLPSEGAEQKRMVK